MRRAFVEGLTELAERDDRVLLLTADLGFSYLEAFRDRFPTRFFNVGVAEENLIGLATGLAEDGFVPFTYTMAAFALPRSFEMVRNGPVAHSLPVRLVGVGGGFDYGVSGPSHYALDDLALARALGPLDVSVPADDEQTRTAVFATQDLRGPVYLRLGNEERGALPAPMKASQSGRVVALKEGAGEVCILALGPTAFDALAAADSLEKSGVKAGVIVLSSLRPLDVDALLAPLRGVRLLATIENHGIEGGLGSIVAEALLESGSRSRLLRAGVAVRGFPPGSPAYLRAQLGLDGPSLARRISGALEQA